jgi:hypothetical protein
MIKAKRTTASDILNQCTGMMKVDADGKYAGYYKRGELYSELLKQGHPRDCVEMFFIGLRECKEVHPDVGAPGGRLL